MDVNDIKAGPYEVAAVHFDQQTSKPGEPFDYTRYRTGDVVTLDAADARRLILAGAVIEPGARERAAADAARAFYEAALAALPQEVRDEHVAGQTSQQDSPDDLDELLAAREQLLAEIAELEELRAGAASSPPAAPEVPGPVAPADGGAPALTDGEQAPAGSTAAAPNAEGSQEPPAPVRPQQVHAKALWVTYRIGQGMPAEAAEGATKNQLIRAEPPLFEITGE